MPLTADAKIATNPNAKTLYITIPAVLAQDSAFPFKPGETVKIEIVTDDTEVSKGVLVVHKSETTTTSKRK